MGDTPRDSNNRSSDHEGIPENEATTQAVQPTSGLAVSGSLNSTPAFHSQITGIPQQQQQQQEHVLRSRPSLPSHDLASAQNQAVSPFSMASVANALPEYAAAQTQAQRGPVARGQQVVASSQYGGAYGVGQYPVTVAVDQGFDPTGQQHGHRQPIVGSLPSAYGPYGQQIPHFFYPNPTFASHGQQHAFFPGHGAPVASFDPRTGAPVGQGTFAPGSLHGQSPGRHGQNMALYGDAYQFSDVGTYQASLDRNIGSIPRGPPRKPKQSGHALWVGNLPPGTTVIDLKDHFSRDATKDIESLFLISKSNCAFVNYRTETSCAAAMQRFHDSRFNGVRLVCRLRRTSAPPIGVPTGPSAMSPSSAPTSATSPSAQSSPTIADSSAFSKEETSKAENSSPATDVPPEATGKVKDRFFIVKSLTLQDLELSVQNGIWATQAHNEDALNKAYQAAENVYLIFSANKSGEYFGYARMASPINEDGKQIFGTVPRHEPVVEAADAPRTIPTPATEFAPAGHIIDDSARGTIFWEAEHSDDETTEEETKEAAVAAATDAADPDAGGGAGQQTWGKPFKIEWMSTSRLPFYRTRGLRNPWNANREVKIARDGTELEPGVGMRLIQMFHRMPQHGTGQIPPHMVAPHLGQVRSYV